ncbi:MAG: hypothetical protein GY845_18205, partial [Planctomycetes bacterium]|nr:hypothetical protein [Planctomycetota bacterium]
MNKIAYLIIVILIIGISVCSANLAFAQPERISVSPVTDEVKQLKDNSVRAILVDEGIDPNFVELITDYSIVNGDPYSQIYKDRLTGSSVMVIGQIPRVDSFGNMVRLGWDNVNGIYHSKENLFACTVDDTRVEIINESSQPNGSRIGDSIVYDPVIYLGGVEIKPVSRVANLLSRDPLNRDLERNVLEWDYGVCKRYLRLIEGSVQGLWLFDDNPGQDILIQYNQIGDMVLKLGVYANSPDSEFITVDNFHKQLSERGPPVIIGDTLTFYPDADTETSSVDGYVWRTSAGTWSSLVNGVGNGCSDTALTPSIQIAGNATTSWFNGLYRSIFTFDTSSLPNDCTINSATLSIYGRSKGDDASIDPHFNIYSCTPTNIASLMGTDFNLANWGSTALCDTSIDYSSWNLSGYNDFALNASGLALISKTGTSKFGAREASYDAPNSSPADMGGTQSAWMGWHPAEAGSGYEPKLVVIYTDASAPTVSTGTTLNVGVNSFVAYGTIIDVSGGTPTSRGICWTESGTPTISDAKTVSLGNFGTGSYNAELTDLNAETSYNYRAYATSASGTG